MGKILILSVTDHEEHILNKIMETIANEPELNHIAPPLPCNILSFTNLEIRLKEQTVSCSGQLVTLTHHEFAVLTYLARHPGCSILVICASFPYFCVYSKILSIVILTFPLSGVLLLPQLSLFALLLPDS